MGKLKNAFHDEICWNGLDADEREEWLAASADTHPKDGDALAAPLVSGAVGAAETPNPSHRSTGE